MHPGAGIFGGLHLRPAVGRRSDALQPGSLGHVEVGREEVAGSGTEEAGVAEHLAGLVQTVAAHPGAHGLGQQYLVPVLLFREHLHRLAFFQLCQALIIGGRLGAHDERLAAHSPGPQTRLLSQCRKDENTEQERQTE